MPAPEAPSILIPFICCSRVSIEKPPLLLWALDCCAALLVAAWPLLLPDSLLAPGGCSQHALIRGVAVALLGRACAP